MRKIAIPLAALVLATGANHAEAAMSEKQAREKAIEILLGDPYGNTPQEVGKHIKDAKLLSDGKTLACGSVKNAIWQFHVVVEKPVNNPDSPIDGYLVIDANSGEIVCANLPMLD